MPRVKGYPRRRYATGTTSAMGRRIRRGRRNVVSRRLLTVGRMINSWHQGVNYASVKETYQLPVPAGNTTYFRDALADLNFDRSQAVAQAYQQYRIKYIKLTFKPNNDTYTAGGGANIPQLYFMIDKTRSIPAGANAGTFFSIGCKPIRMDDKNIVKAWKPSVLTGNLDNAGQVQASQLKISPWLSTNGNAQPGGAWVPDETFHHGAVFYITKTNPNDGQNYLVDVEVMFEFRRPNWKQGESSQDITMVDAGVVTHSTYQPGVVSP